jgi:hypothetical protein
MRPIQKQHKGGISVKFRVPCQHRITSDTPTTKEWLRLQEIIYKHTSGEVGIARATLDKRAKEIIVKFGPRDAIFKEYEIASQLKDIPNYMRYFCVFSCDDDAADILRRDLITKPYVCKGNGTQIGMLLMPYCSTGSIGQYRWTASNFSLLKNVLTQTCFALMYAYTLHGFVHGDMHLDNVLLKPTKKTHLTYGDSIQLSLQSHYAMIMDFESKNTKIQRDVPPSALWDSIRRAVHLACVLDNSDLAIEYDQSFFMNLMTQNIAVEPSLYDTIKHKIDTLVIRLDRTKTPKNPFTMNQT